MEIQWNAEPNGEDDRVPALAAAEQAMADPSVVGEAADRLAAIEDYRRELRADTTVFDQSHGSVTVSRVARVGSSDPGECRFLHTLVRRLAPARVVEMGTAIGISAAYMAAGLPSGGRLWTVDQREASARHARRLFDRLGLPAETVTGTFDDVLEDVLERAAPVDLLFVDGHHQEAATLRYTDRARPHLSARAVVVFDDVRWSEGMQRAWSTIRSQPRWTASVDFDMWGVCLV